MFILISFFNIRIVHGDKTEALLRISEAEDSIEASYLSVLELYRTGVDISNHVAFLNAILDYYYSDAVLALESEDYTTVDILAGRIIEESKLILESDVNFDVDRFVHLNEVRFRNQLFLSLGTVCLIILYGFFSWKTFKTYYVKKMMELKPEVPEDKY